MRHLRITDENGIQGFKGEAAGIAARWHTCEYIYVGEGDGFYHRQSAKGVMHGYLLQGGHPIRLEFKMYWSESVAIGRADTPEPDWVTEARGLNDNRAIPLAAIRTQLGMDIPMQQTMMVEV